jgi:hypothetical protein
VISCARSRRPTITLRSEARQRRVALVVEQSAWIDVRTTGCACWVCLMICSSCAPILTAFGVTPREAAEVRRERFSPNSRPRGVNGSSNIVFLLDISFEFKFARRAVGCFRANTEKHEKHKGEKNKWREKSEKTTCPDTLFL